MLTHFGHGSGKAPPFKLSELTFVGDAGGIAFFFGTAMYSFEGIGVVSETLYSQFFFSSPIFSLNAMFTGT